MKKHFSLGLIILFAVLFGIGVWSMYTMFHVDATPQGMGG
jgi:hypothetical protein